MATKRIAAGFSLLATLAVGCAGARTNGTQAGAGAQHHIIVDGEAIQTNAQNLFEFLQPYAQVRRVLARRAGGDPDGLLIVDGVAMVEPERLMDIPLYDVRRVDLMNPAQAMLRYGGKAKAGAIVVETRRTRR